MIRDMLKTDPTDALRPQTAMAGDVLDPDAIDKLYEELDAEVVQEILTAAAADVRQHGGRLLAMEPGEAAEVRRAAHALAGVSVAVGATALSVLARRIERAAALGADRDGLRLAVDDTVAALVAAAADREGSGLPPAA